MPFYINSNVGSSVWIDEREKHDRQTWQNVRQHAIHILIIIVAAWNTILQTRRNLFRHLWDNCRLMMTFKFSLGGKNHIMCVWPLNMFNRAKHQIKAIRISLKHVPRPQTHLKGACVSREHVWNQFHPVL